LNEKQTRKLADLLDAAIAEIGENEDGGQLLRHLRGKLSEETWGNDDKLDWLCRNLNGLSTHGYFSDEGYQRLRALVDYLWQVTAPAPCIKFLLDEGVSSLAKLSSSAKLDAELLLSAALAKPRSYLYAWPQKRPSAEQVKTFYGFMQRRRAGEPIAYILGKQGFYSLELSVNQHSLIPRADTETLVEAALQRLPNTPARLLDLGTGSGAIALALAHERPAWQLLGVDKQFAAVMLAEHNRQSLGLANVQFLQSDWFSAVSGQRFAAVLSNPPYIAEDDKHLSQGDVRFEPRTALIAGIDGLDDLRHIIRFALNYLEAGGWLMLEHGWQQAEAVRALLAAAGFSQIESLRDLGGNWRVSLGRLG